MGWLYSNRRVGFFGFGCRWLVGLGLADWKYSHFPCERLAELGQNGVDFCLAILKVIVFIGVSRCGADAIRVILAFQLI